MEQKYTVRELFSMYQEKKKINPDYSFHDLFIDLLRLELKEILNRLKAVNADIDPDEGDRGSHQDQAPEDFLK